MRLTAIGLIIGVAVAFFAARAMSALLQGIEPQDPLTIATAALTCIVVVLAGCLRPALRASRVDPMSALRSS